MLAAYLSLKASCLKAHEGGAVFSLWCARHKSCGYCYYGGGVVGANAARLVVVWARVTVFDRSLRKLRYLSDIFGSLETRHSTDAALAEALLSADMVIGAVLIPGHLHRSLFLGR